MRYPFIVALALLAFGTCHARPPDVDCAAVRQALRDRVEAVQLDRDPQSAVDSMGTLTRVANGLTPPERACLAESDLRSVLSLFDHPQAAVRMDVPGFFAEFGVRAQPLLPELRNRIESAREHDRKWAEERQKIEGALVVVVGSTELGSLEYALERIASARILEPEWRDGVCARLETDAANGDSRIVRYLHDPVAQADCTARHFDLGNSWFYTENEGETVVFSEAAFAVAKRLHSLPLSNLRAADVCPDGSDSVAPDLLLADMAAWWVGHDSRGYELVLRTLPSIRPHGVQIALDLDADTPLVRGAVKPGSCREYEPGF